MNRYAIFKPSGTHADAMTAIGAADLLRHLDPRVADCGDRFEVRFSRKLKQSDLRAVDPGFAYLLRPRKNVPGEAPERILGAAISCTTAAESRMYSILGRMRADSGPNKLLSRYAGMKPGEWERRVWNCLQGETDFVFRAPLVQLFDPHAARGYGMLKPLGTNRSDHTKNKWARPFDQWLRFRGYFQGSAGWFAQGDLRLFTPIPFDISYERLTKVAENFRELRFGGTGTKMDCRAVLGFTRLLIESCHRKRRPREMVSGLWVTRYKDMGQAHTVIGMDQLALPDWMDLHSDEHVRRWLDILEEHDTAVRRLTDSHSEEFGLLQQYRRTFQADRQDAVAAFVEFLASYGPLTFRRRAQDHWVLTQFSLKSVTEIFDASPECSTVLDAPGFGAVAGAVRSATFGAQGNRHRGRPDHREIRYGLFSDLRCAGHVGKQELIAAVSQFISDFNKESVRRRAAGLPASTIRETEWNQFLQIVEHAPDTGLVAALLCGISSCHRGEIGAAVEVPAMVQASLLPS
jgi:hypothetical protein